MQLAPPMYPADPWGGPPTGRGFEGHGSEYVPQNQINVKGVLNGPHLDHLHASGGGRSGLYAPASESVLLQVLKNDFAVTANVTHPRFAGADADRPAVHSAFNGDGADEVAEFPDDPELQKAALMFKYAFAGVAYDGMPHVSLKDVGKSQSLALTVAGTTTHMSREHMYPGALVMLRLPGPGDQPMRSARDVGGAVKLFPTVKTPETVWKLVSGAVKRHIFGRDDLEARRDRRLRKIDPGRNAHEAFADAVVVFGLEFMKALIDAGIVTVEHAPRAGSPFDFRMDRGREMENGEVLLGLAKGFGIVPPESRVEGVEFNLERYTAFHRLRKLLVGMAFYDGTTPEHAFSRGMDEGVVGWTKERSRQTPAQRVTQAQIDAPRDLVAAIDDLKHEAYRWVIGTCIQGAPKGKPFRLHLK